MRTVAPDWHLAYLGKPWANVPRPPQSYTCGELVRAVHRDLLGIDSPPIPVPDAGVLRDCVAAMKPEIFGLAALPPGARPRELDVAFFARARDRDHCGIACATADGLMILHCLQREGVRLDSQADMRGVYGYRHVRWYRHGGTDAALAARGWLHA